MLEARDLVHHYPGGVTALDHVDLVIPAGGRLAILGANGAGKSTLLLALAGAIRTDRGQVILDGSPVTHDRKGLTRLRHRVGLVFQDPDDQLFAATVAEDVSFGPLNLGLTMAEARGRTAEALDMMGVAHLADRATHMLSFGQRKRVAIAGLLAMRPGILLLDEPTAGLDPAGVDELMQRLDAVAGTGTAVVIATHDMDLANGWADRIAVFGRGQIVLDGPPEAVFEDEALLAALGLRLPMLRRLAGELAARGLLKAGPLPRRLEDLVAGLPGHR